MWRVASTLNVNFNGFRFDFGTGGIHGAVSKTKFYSDKDVVIKSYDVASYYPNLAIKNRVYPEHLSEMFCDIYEDVYNQRKSFPKGSVENAMMKLALNGVYGDSNNKFSPFYDPKYTMTITINGQLLLCKLAEKLSKIDGLRVIMANTDGLEFIVPREHESLSHRVCQEWEELTGLQLEGATYSKLLISDVNNYIGVFDE
jgi:DNA polymerase elongation subunit (family B)